MTPLRISTEQHALDLDLVHPARPQPLMEVLHPDLYHAASAACDSLS